MSADKLSDAYFTAEGRLVPEKPAPHVTPAPRKPPTQRDLILAAYDSLAAGAHISPLDPPPGDRAHTPFCGKDGRGCICRTGAR